VSVLDDEAHPFVHHPLSAADVKELFGNMPADVRSIVRSVHLRVGTHEDEMRADGAEPDPFTGRYGFQTEGGIWAPALLGRYRSEHGEIDLFGYVFDEAALRVPEIQLVLLWLRQAQTLAHEVAHCWDDIRRTDRDRWALDEETRAENFADNSARRWLVAAVVPYFKRQHPQTVVAFEAWLMKHIGIPITLERVAEDADRSMWGLVEGLFEVCAKWTDRDELNFRVEIAEQFHFVDDFAPARQILEGVLLQRPGHEAATILMGDVAVHEEDWQRALEWTEKALVLSPGSVDAHIDRIAALIGASNWPKALDECDRALQMTEALKADRAAFGLNRARCLIELGEFTKADEQLDQVTSDGPPLRARAAQVLRAESLLRQSRWADARSVAVTALRTRQYPWHDTQLTSVAWECARLMGQADPKPVPTQRHVELLRQNGRNDWADRLLALGLKPEANRRTRRQVKLTQPRGRLSRL
jgi:tetratricopeptide (TPR) repeat protein